ncbi:hypothetical protein HKX48_000198 [Thoreauomyces humboldtii]|nr:hypothetical protein HKX48_000198 [Thoreauomyces humboldtii]
MAIEAEPLQSPDWAQAQLAPRAGPFRFTSKLPPRVGAYVERVDIAPRETDYDRDVIPRAIYNDPITELLLREEGVSGRRQRPQDPTARQLRKSIATNAARALRGAGADETTKYEEGQTTESQLVDSRTIILTDWGIDIINMSYVAPIPALVKPRIAAPNDRPCYHPSRHKALPPTFPRPVRFGTWRNATGVFPPVIVKAAQKAAGEWAEKERELADDFVLKYMKVRHPKPKPVKKKATTILVLEPVAEHLTVVIAPSQTPLVSASPSLRGGDTPSRQISDLGQVVASPLAPAVETAEEEADRKDRERDEERKRKRKLAAGLAAASPAVATPDSNPGRQLTTNHLTNAASPLPESASNVSIPPHEDAVEVLETAAATVSNESLTEVEKPATETSEDDAEWLEREKQKLYNGWGRQESSTAVVTAAAPSPVVVKGGGISRKSSTVGSPSAMPPARSDHVELGRKSNLIPGSRNGQTSESPISAIRSFVAEPAASPRAAASFVTDQTATPRSATRQASVVSGSIKEDTDSPASIVLPSSVHITSDDDVADAPENPDDSVHELSEFRRPSPTGSVASLTPSVISHRGKLSAAKSFFKKSKDSLMHRDDKVDNRDRKKEEKAREKETARREKEEKEAAKEAAKKREKELKAAEKEGKKHGKTKSIGETGGAESPDMTNIAKVGFNDQLKMMKASSGSLHVASPSIETPSPSVEAEQERMDRERDEERGRRKQARLQQEHAEQEAAAAAAVAAADALALQQDKEAEAARPREKDARAAALALQQERDARAAALARRQEEEAAVAAAALVEQRKAREMEEARKAQELHDRIELEKQELVRLQAEKDRIALEERTRQEEADAEQRRQRELQLARLEAERIAQAEADARRVEEEAARERERAEAAASALARIREEEDNAKRLELERVEAERQEEARKLRLVQEAEEADRKDRERDEERRRRKEERRIKEEQEMAIAAAAAAALAAEAQRKAEALQLAHRQRELEEREEEERLERVAAAAKEERKREAAAAEAAAQAKAAAEAELRAQKQRDQEEQAALEKREQERAAQEEKDRAEAALAAAAKVAAAEALLKEKAKRARQEEEKRIAEEARQAEMQAKVEIARREEERRKAEEAREAEMQTRAEVARREDEARKADEAREAEMQVKALVARGEEEAKKADEARQAEEQQMAQAAAVEKERIEAAQREEKLREREKATEKERLATELKVVEARKAEEASEAARRAADLENAQRAAEEARVVTARESQTAAAPPEPSITPSPTREPPRDLPANAGRFLNAMDMQALQGTATAIPPVAKPLAVSDPEPEEDAEQDVPETPKHSIASLAPSPMTSSNTSSNLHRKSITTSLASMWGGAKGKPDPGSRSRTSIASIGEGYKLIALITWKAVKLDVRITEHDMQCVEPGKPNKQYKHFFPLELRRIVSVSPQNTEAVVYACVARKGTRGGSKFKKMVFAFPDKAKATAWSEAVMNLAYGGAENTAAKGVLVLVDKFDSKEAMKMVEKYMKPVWEAVSKNCEVKAVQYNEFSVGNVLSTMDFTKLGNIVCLNNPDFTPRLQQVLVRNQHTRNPVSLPCESDPVDAALTILRSTIGKSKAGVLHVTGVTLKREEGKMGGFMKAFK